MKLILFDIDGTLLISKGLGREAKARAMIETFGTDAEVRTHPFGGKTDWQILNELLVPRGFTVEQIGERMPAYQTIFARNMAELADQFTTTPCPGSHELIQEMRQRDDLLLGLVTGNTRETAPVKLKTGGFDPAWFRVGAFGNESHDRNDLPKLALERARDYSGRDIQAEDVYVIGDTIADVLCARALGCVAVAVLTGFESPTELLASQPDYVLENLTYFWDKVVL